VNAPNADDGLQHLNYGTQWEWVEHALWLFTAYWNTPQYLPEEVKKSEPTRSREERARAQT